MISILERFHDIVTRHPEKTAILTDGQEPVTYRDLDLYARRYADYLREMGVSSQDVVAIHITKSAGYIEALFGCLFIGATFVPLDPNLPIGRKDHILRQSGATCILTEQAFSSPPSGIRLFFRHDIAEHKSVLPGLPMIAPEQSAYIIFTSGSTGRPKGVVVPHRGIMSVIDAQIDITGLGPGERSLFLLSVNFDASLSDIWTALLSGATLCIETTASEIIASRLCEIIRTRQITYIDLPPSLLSVLPKAETLSPLRCLLIGGEVGDRELIRYWASRLRLISVYGPTEATICSSMIICDATRWTAPSIGTPLSHVTYYVVALGTLSDAPKGMTGELLIGGHGVATGYIGEPDLTAKKFLHHAEERIFRTGDLVKRIVDEYIFVGRIDRQVKIHGKLVAPEEIEQTLMMNPQVERAAVIINDQSHIHAFVQMPLSDSIIDLRSFVSRFLPHWMIPQMITALSSLPQQTNGKVNYHALEAYAKSADTPAKEISTEGDTPTETLLLRVWREVLHTSKIMADTDLYHEARADSLAIISAVVKARGVHIDVPIRLLQEHHTVRTQARAIETGRGHILSDAIAVTDVSSDSILDRRSRALCREARQLPYGDPSVAFITGANGFLGVHLLPYLLRHHMTVYALIRARDTKEARDRLTRALNKYGITLTKKEGARLHYIIGDIALPQFGLADNDWSTLASRVGVIYHLAAVVNMVLPYHDLKTSNVDGTKGVLHFALHTKRKILHHISTLSVFVATDRNHGKLCENDDLSRTTTLYGGYAASKWVAERCLQSVPPDTLTIAIYRLGLLTGEHITGQSSEHDFLHTFIRGLTEFADIPKGDHSSLFLDVTPVDYAAVAIATIATQVKTSQTFHIAGKTGFSLADILAVLEEKNISIASKDPSVWAAAYSASIDSPCQAAAYMALCRVLPHRQDFEQLRSMDLFQATDVTFDQTNTEQMLRASGITLPIADRALLRRYINAMEDNND